MTLQQLIYVVKIAECKSMNKAAAQLYISQPALSSAIHDLEEEIHMPLFLRNNRGIAITPEGEEFLGYARQMTELQEVMEETFLKRDRVKKKFSVSMQHYSFAVEAFIELAKQLEMNDYEFAVHETKTSEVIENVRNNRSELGILYLNEFNERAMQKIFAENKVEFIPLYPCEIYAYISKVNPLAAKEKVTFEDLEPYPCLTFEQGEKNSFYFAEEVFSTYEARQTIKADDRATMLNLMVGLNGYTLCSGIICEKLNGEQYTAIPLDTDEKMTLGYIKRKKVQLSTLGKQYLQLLEKIITSY